MTLATDQNPPGKHTLRFLGTGASCGTPSYYCGCKACEEALADPKAQRTCAALLISGQENTLLDAGPDLRMQLSLARAQTIQRALFTHEHFDHIGGIPQLEYYVRLVSREPLPIYAGNHTLEAIEQQFAFMNDTLETHEILAQQSLIFDGVSYTALPAVHGIQTFGFLIQKPGAKRIAYFPDTGPLTPEVFEALKNIDVLIVDASFNGRNWMPTSHLTIADAVELAQSLEAKQTYLTHLTMHYDEPITTSELGELLEPLNGVVQAAHDGLEIEF